MLGADEIELIYREQPIDQAMTTAFKSYLNVPVSDPEAGAKLLGHLKEIAARGEKAVVHCFAGENRTGSVLAAYLRAAHGLSAEEAVAEVVGSAQAAGATRGVKADIVNKLLAQQSTPNK